LVLGLHRYSRSLEGVEVQDRSGIATVSKKETDVLLSLDLRLDYRFYGTDEMAVGVYVRDHTPPTAVFLTSGQHINPINCIGGIPLS